jgi:hypothetical protein
MPRPGQRTSKPVPLAAHLPFTMKTIGAGKTLDVLLDPAMWPTATAAC